MKIDYFGCIFLLYAIFLSEKNFVTFLNIFRHVIPIVIFNNNIYSRVSKKVLGKRVNSKAQNDLGDSPNFFYSSES